MVNTNLHQKRIEAGLSQSKVAERAGISVRVYQNYEQGVRDIGCASAVTVLRICLALKCRAAEIMSDAEVRQVWIDYENK